VEATALGNALVQARALGAAPASLSDMRSMLRECVSVRRYLPDGSPAAWSAAARRVAAPHEPLP
jgi:rhamnulokinase